MPGHEIIGDVVAIPPTETKWKIGQRVGGGWHGGHCHHCARCSAGDYMTCEKEAINGINRHGGYAEYVTLRTEAVVSVPDDMDPAEIAPLMCAGVTVFNSLRNMSSKAPQFVAVQGIGGLGHLGIQFAKAMGYRVVALSSSPAKEALARELGAEIYIDGSKADQAEELAKLGGASVIMCTAPNPEVIRTLQGGLAVNGELLILALAADTTISLVPLIARRQSIRGWPSGTAADTEACVQFARAHGTRTMVTTFPLERAQEAYDFRAKARFRAVLLPRKLLSVL